MMRTRLPVLLKAADPDSRRAHDRSHFLAGSGAGQQAGASGPAPLLDPAADSLCRA